MQDGTLSGGMIPKVETCIDATGRASTPRLVDGRDHGVLLEIFTEHGRALIRRDGTRFQRICPGGSHVTAVEGGVDASSS